MIRWLLGIANRTQLSVRTIIAAFDLLERYLAHYSVPDDQLGLLGATLLCTSYKLTQVGEYFSDLFDSKFKFDHREIIFDHIRTEELTVVAELNYTLISCEIDEYVDRLLDFDESLTQTCHRLKRTYQLIAKDGDYPGAMTYDRIIRYLSIQPVQRSQRVT